MIQEPTYKGLVFLLDHAFGKCLEIKPFHMQPMKNDTILTHISQFRCELLFSPCMLM